MDQKLYTVYAIQCIANKKLYIGCTSNLNTRINQHFSDLRRGIKTMRISHKERGPSPWQSDYNQHGEGAFQVHVIKKDIPSEKRKDVEAYYINLYRSNEIDFGYNKPPSPNPIPYIEGPPTGLAYEPI